MIKEPFPEENRSLFKDPLLQLNCLDAGLALESLVNHFSNILFTSGSAQQKQLFPKVLNLTSVTNEKSVDVKLARNTISPLIITKGID